MPKDAIDFEWTDVWKLMPAEEQEKAVDAFTHGLRHGEDNLRRKLAPVFFHKLARTLHFRQQTIEVMSDVRLARAIRQAMPGIMADPDWPFLFIQHYFSNNQKIMCRFLDLCGIEHDGQGRVDGEVIPPADVLDVVKIVEGEFGAAEVLRYFMVLLLLSRDNWSFIEPALAELQKQVESHPVEVHAPASVLEEASPIDRELADDFTQLDRVLIEQVISSAAGEERALSPEELHDLVATVHALNTRRNRTYFHLGFLNALLGDAEEVMNGPEMNDTRREWYLAGLLAGFARQRDMEQIDRCLQQCKDDFDRAAQTTGGAGASMAKTIFPLLLESGRLSSALALLKGQIGVVGYGMGFEALNHCSELLRRGEPVEAKTILSILHGHLKELLKLGMQDFEDEFCRVVRRKLGQAFQACGELDRARSLFEELLAGGDSASAKLLADMGLVESGFSGIQEVRIEGDLDRRRTVMAALAKGSLRFEEAVERFQDEAHHAHYALAVFDYLRFMDSDGEDREDASLAQSARHHAEIALSGIIGSDESDAFDRLGITGQCRFILAVLRMSMLDQSQAISAMQAWKGIPAHAGRFPPDHLERFLEWSDATDEELAIQIAESIWEVRGAEALELLRQQEWVVRSDKLREAFHSAAGDTDQPRARRFELLAFLVPALLQGNYQEQAAEGLDAMEGLAEESSELARKFLNFLLGSRNYDPAWSEADALRARYRCSSRLGDNTEAVATLRNLFHAVKDENPEEAAQIRELVKYHEGGEKAVADLVLPEVEEPLSTEESKDIEERLRNGESVKVLFIGGNETQAQYDERVRNAIRKDWPGVEILFEHTGWTSNWGQQADYLKKKAVESDAVVLMSMMRTMLGKKMRAVLNDPPRPWIPCTATGKKAMEQSIRKAVQVAIA